MPDPPGPRRPHTRAMEARPNAIAMAATLAAACLALAAPAAQAGTASSNFNVTVQLTGDGTGVCDTRGSTIRCGGGGVVPPVGPPPGLPTIVVGATPPVLPPVVGSPPNILTPPAVTPPVVTPPGQTPPVDPPPAGGGGYQPPIVFPPTVTPPITVNPGGGILQPPLTTSPFRFVAAVSRSGELLGTVDIYSGSGTVTAWRVVNFGDREYLEMTLGW